MGQKSKIVQLDPRIRAAVDQAVREGRATIDEIVALVESMGGQASRSSVGRYVKNAAEQLKAYRETQEIAKTWVGEIHENPNGDVGRLAAEVLRMAAYQASSVITASDKPVKPMDVMLLAKALDHLSSQGKRDVEKFIKVRDQIGAKLKKLEDKASRGGKISAQDLEAIRRDVYGISTDKR